MTEIPKPSGRRGRPPASAGQGLTRERVVAAALALLDERGLEAFSVRDLARSLGVYPAAIYWHVPNRNALLAAMVAEVLSGLAPPAGTAPWQEWLRALFRGYRGAVRRHPNIAPLIGAQLVSNASIDLGLMERLLEVLRDAGFRDQGLVAAFNVVVAAQVGFVTLEFAPAPAEDAPAWEEGMRALLAGVRPDRYPLLAAHLPRMANRSFTLRWQNGTAMPLDAHFEAYVDTVIAGLERRAAEGR
ncbi:TetR/AcrR family transcriptional regulator C-terminal domain-containing protein [Roseomonas sp. OT10]|uniref:TetR/AcrR family transcriptional regulator C-terminal domain-containing protein n=1 Tax=Roseomonas cutis TaxID=2897332 RepID=UPI001E3A77F5|nr:TetR/AcrR family transcriptional regulator C-terminal domain-containing protein [Roseomonas sp. OT10]UFN49972.1 TetR/AcrR family transcriptional regulator C-terminal domain-containing protein [Roseomonas sp. OT10]